MRVAYVCADSGVPVFGGKGCSVHVQEVVRAFLKRGAQVDLFATSLDGDPPADLASVRVHRLPATLPGPRAERERAALEANHGLRAHLEGEGGFDLVYERYSLWSYAAMEHARARQTPGLLEVNAPLIEEQAEHRGLVDRAGAERVAERVFAAARRLVAVSDELARELDHHRCARGRVHVLPNAIDPDRFPPGTPPSRPGRRGTFTVGFLGSLKPWHGVSGLVTAFSLLHRGDPDTRLLLVGEGPERQRLLEDVRRLGLGAAVEFAGAVPPAGVPGMLASMDVAVAPYPEMPRFYFSPLKVYEYMAAGLPLVASRVGQLAGLITDGANGLVVRAGDPRALFLALDRLRRDGGLRARLGAAARATVLRDHTWDRVVERIVGLAGLPSWSGSTVVGLEA